MTASPTFRLVQVNLSGEINPREDMRSWRRFFYIDLVGFEFKRDEWGPNTTEIYVTKKEEDGKLMITINNGKGRSRPVFTEVRAGHAVTNPPWPIGHFILPPEH